MTNEQSSITPPDQLVQQWINNAHISQPNMGAICREVATKAIQWGADQELEACCEWLQDPELNVDTYKLRAARRPKPPSLKEQALLQLDTLNADLAMHGRGCDLSQIRRALETL